MTYTQLLADIADTLNRQDLTARIPSWVRLAEAHFSRKLIHPLLSTFQEYTVTDGQVRLLDTVRSIENIQLKDVNQEIQLGYQTQFDGVVPLSGNAHYYTLQGQYVLLYPQPVDGSILQIRALNYVPPLDEQETERNWLLDLAPDLYLYGALVHSAPYLKEDERIAIWKGLRDEIIEDLNTDVAVSQMGTTATLSPNINTDAVDYAGNNILS